SQELALPVPTPPPPTRRGFFSRASGQAFAFFSAFFSDLGAAAFFAGAAALAFLGGAFGALAYFFWKRSMRPCVSISFCLPVKKGWQFEQISRCKSPPVERVSQLAPQAQWTFETG